MAMNLLRIYGATLLVALTMGMSACKNEDAPVTAPATNAEANSGQKISLNVDIEGLPTSDLRAMEIQENIVGNQHAGLKFKWTIGSTEKFFIAFKKESGSSFTASGPMVVRESTLTILSQEGNRYKARIDVDAPSGFNPDTETIFVAGALGVKDIDATTGRALVPGPRYFFDKGKSYIPPMYFAPTRLRSKTVGGSKEYYADNLTFRFYGAMVGATIDNTQGNMLYSPHEITMQTDALTTEGALNLFDLESDSNGQSVPKWTTEQNATTTQRVYFDQGDVAVGQKRTYYFWAVPSTFSGRREMSLELRTDAYDKELGATASDVSTKWRVKQLASAKVHRLQADIPAPKGDLIITEVFIGGGDYGAATAWEFYNPTDVDINLKDYYIQRFDYNTSSNSYPSSPTYESSLLPNPALLKSGSNSLDKSGQLGIRRGILPAHKSAVFYTASVTNKNMMNTFQSRTGLVYLFNIVSETFRDVIEGRDRSQQKLEYAQAFFAPRFRSGGKQYRSRHRIVRKVAGKSSAWGSTVIPIDAFFWYSNGIRAQYPTASFFRKPGRDLPRAEMQINHNSDWVMRHRYEALDWGYRFSYYFDRNRVNTPALGIHWMEDTSTGSTIPALSAKNGYIYERPIFAPDYSKNDMSFDELKQEAQLYKYVPPMWWTKERAQAADR
ncbi:MAG: lamin tail domain-containing protein [Porphyromonadaceae bacterium]|nr:lamin tail domain-containing protein [Porphyromonadaceae bacterium]